MRHLQKTKKFKRTEEERKRLWVDLSTALINNGTILTFTARAKWFRPKFERLVSLVKRSGDNKQLAFTKVRPFLSEKVARRLIEVIVPGLKDRQGGYTMQVKVFQEFSPHDKSIVKITSQETPSVAMQAATQTKVEDAVTTLETSAETETKPVEKKKAVKKTTKKPAKKSE